jgi:nucleoside 2-deoxyribosyltransferase
MFERKVVYLAAPYSDPDPRVIEERMEQFCRTDSVLIKKGFSTVSPLYKHFMLKYCDLPGDWEYWRNYSLELLERSDALFILELDGWDKSTGVTHEIESAGALKIPVYGINADGEIVTTFESVVIPATTHTSA